VKRFLVHLSRSVSCVSFYFPFANCFQISKQCLMLWFQRYALAYFNWGQGHSSALYTMIDIKHQRIPIFQEFFVMKSINLEWKGFLFICHVLYLVCPMLPCLCLVHSWLPPNLAIIAFICSTGDIPQQWQMASFYFPFANCFQISKQCLMLWFQRYEQTNNTPKRNQHFIRNHQFKIKLTR
jgi:hypothetical protein